MSDPTVMWSQGESFCLADLGDKISVFFPLAELILCVALQPQIRHEENGKSMRLASVASGTGGERLLL